MAHRLPSHQHIELFTFACLAFLVQWPVVNLSPNAGFNSSVCRNTLAATALLIPITNRWWTPLIHSVGRANLPASRLQLYMHSPAPIPMTPTGAPSSWSDSARARDNNDDDDCNSGEPLWWLGLVLGLLGSVFINTGQVLAP